jgi:hypothetical protein
MVAMMANETSGRTTNIGIWVWGGLTAVASVTLFAVIVTGGAYLDAEGKFLPGTPRFVAGMYHALKDQGTLIGALVGFSALAWAHFYGVGNKIDAE